MEEEKNIVLEVQNVKHNLNVMFEHKPKTVTNIKSNNEEIKDGEEHS